VHVLLLHEAAGDSGLIGGNDEAKTSIAQCSQGVEGIGEILDVLGVVEIDPVLYQRPVAVKEYSRSSHFPP
jgi:hypothetical protein